jgi:hypothetical protein
MTNEAASGSSVMYIDSTVSMRYVPVAECPCCRVHKLHAECLLRSAMMPVPGCPCCKVPKLHAECLLQSDMLNAECQRCMQSVCCRVTMLKIAQGACRVPVVERLAEYPCCRVFKLHAECPCRAPVALCPCCRVSKLNAECLLHSAHAAYRVSDGECPYKMQSSHPTRRVLSEYSINVVETAFWVESTYVKDGHVIIEKLLF